MGVGVYDRLGVRPVINARGMNTMASGSLMPRDLMPEKMKMASLATPHAWALDAYNQLFLSPTPNLMVVMRSCAALLIFGAAFLQVALWRLRLD